MEIDVLIQAIESHRVRITDHADEEVHADNLVLDDIYFSVSQGEIIEDYPTDFPFPSCLLISTFLMEWRLTLASPQTVFL